METHRGIWTVAAMAAGLASTSAAALAVEPTIVPEAEPFQLQRAVEFIGYSDIARFGALPEYHEPDWVTAKYVETGILPPVEERLPAEPLVFLESGMPDGTGEYGGTLRHLTGGRPQGWNWWAGQTQGWGGVNLGFVECLTRIGPLFQVAAEEIQPLPNLARSWEWSGDGHQLTMHLVEGAKWSDGVPFTADDIMFYWNDIVLDPNIVPAGGASADLFGNPELDKIDDYTIRWTFATERPEQYLYTMAFGGICPAPMHALKPEHPSYSNNSYEEFENAFPADRMGFPTLGAWVFAEHRPDDILILRRNPYYWKVDEAGNQLPYLDEVQYKLSSWEARTIQTMAGAADWTNLEQPENFIESLRSASDAESPVNIQFSTRMNGYQIHLNFSNEGWGSPDERAAAVRELNRDLNFRKGISTAIDRDVLGETLIKGPFMSVYAGGFVEGGTYFDREQTVYYPHSIEQARAYFSKAGLEDTDGDGFLNFPEGMADGRNVEILLMARSGMMTDTNLAEPLVSMMRDAGIKLTPVFVDSVQFGNRANSGDFDWKIEIAGREMITTSTNAAALAPVGPRTSYWHRLGGGDTTFDLLDFEEELIAIVEEFIDSNDPGKRAELMSRYQKTFTENVYAVGLVQYSGAMVLNERFRNLADGTPILKYEWAEDSAIRERLFVPSDLQVPGYELLPETLAGLD